MKPSHHATSLGDIKVGSTYDVLVSKRFDFLFFHCIDMHAFAFLLRNQSLEKTL